MSSRRLHRRRWEKYDPAVSARQSHGPGIGSGMEPARTKALGKENCPVSFSSLKKIGLPFSNRNPSKLFCTTTKELPPQPHRQRGSFLFRYRLSEQLSGGGLVANVGSLAKRQHILCTHRRPYWRKYHPRFLGGGDVKPPLKGRRFRPNCTL